LAAHDLRVTIRPAGKNIVKFALVAARSKDMTDYRAYIVGPDGHFKNFEAIIANDDKQAIKIAEKLTDRNVVEVWHLDRKVAVLPKLKPCA
jgi:hypothetical protein